MNLYNFNKFSLKYKIIAPLLLLLIMLFIAIGYVSVYVLTEIYKQNTELLIEGKINEVHTITEQISSKALYIASVASEMNIVQKAYDGYQNTKNINEASKIFEKQFNKINKTIEERVGFKPLIHFHLPPANSFYRSWSKIRGDDISEFRKSVLSVSNNHKAMKGIETGRGGFAIRGIAPIFSSTNTYLGSVEVLFNINQLVTEIKTNTKEEFAVFMLKDLINISTNFLEENASNIKTNKQKVGKYILVEKTKEFKIKSIIKNKDIFNFSKESRFEYENYKYTVIPIKNFVGEVEGIGVLQINIADYKKALNEMIIFELLLFTLSIIIVIIILSYTNNKYIIKPIKNTELALQKLSKGELTDGIIIQGHDEIGSMQYSLNKLSKNIETNTFFAIEIGKGNLDSEYTVLSKNDLLGNSLNEMRKKLIKNSHQINTVLSDSQLNEKKFRDMANLLPQIVYKSDLNGKLVFVNKQAFQSFRYSQVLLENDTLNIFQMIIPEQLSKIKNSVRELLAGKSQKSEEYTALRKDGTTFPILIYTNVITANNKPTGLRGMIIDISERKNFEKEIIKAKEKAEESDKLKTEFMNNMSHEIRTPMNGILGFSRIINKPNLSAEKRAEYTKIIQDSGDQLMKIIDDIIEISELGTKQVQIFETKVVLNDMLLKLFTSFKSIAKKRNIDLYLKNTLTDEESLIFTDEIRLYNTIKKLLENALKFTETGFIELGYKLRKVENKSSISIYVKDTGIGIKEENQQNIFKQFTQEEKEITQKSGGLGLGLSIANGNAKLLGGNISLVSEKGKGSNFTITIPYKPTNPNIKAKIQEEEEEEEAINEKKNNLKKDTILLVEDEEVNHLYINVLLKYILKRESIVLHAQNGEEAIGICRNNIEIDLVLMDLKMPIMDGFKATEEIKKFRPKLPIIAQTAYSTKADKVKAQEAGCDDFISKPIQEQSLKTILDKYLNI